MPNLIKSLLLAALLFNLPSIQASTTPTKAETTPTVEEKRPPDNQSALETYHLIREIIKENIPAPENIEPLKSEIKVQAEQIRQLEKQLAELKNPESNNTTTIVLAALSVIITVLGILVAIVSIWGYQNIKKEAIKAAQESAKKTVTATTEKILPTETENSLVKLIENNQFDKLIQSAVENFIFRDIGISADIPDEDSAK